MIVPNPTLAPPPYPIDRNRSTLRHQPLITTECGIDQNSLRSHMDNPSDESRCGIDVSLAAIRS